MKLNLFFACLILSCNLFSQSIDSANKSICTQILIKKMVVKKFHYFFKSAYNKYHNELNFYCYDFVFNGDGYLGGFSDIKTKYLSGNFKEAIYFKVIIDSTSLINKKTGKPYQYHMACRLNQIYFNDSVTKFELSIIESKYLKKMSLLPTPPHFVKNPIYKKVNILYDEAIKILNCISLYVSKNN